MEKLALISVSDKTKIIEFAKELNLLNYKILATGNTAKLLIEHKIDCIEISSFTSYPEIFSGRVKTLNPKIFGGILMRRDNQTDKIQAEENNIVPIDIVCVNLYPFPKVVDRDDISLEEKIENIDIGGPSLIRAAAKNYKYVSVLTNPEQYDEFLDELKKGEISLETREKLAYAAFAYTSYYDTLIANYFEKEFNQPKKEIRLNYKSSFDLRYGENPHQKAYLFGNFEDYFEVLHGKELSYNNIVDLTAAVELVTEMEKYGCAIIKHTNPCGAAIGNDVKSAYEKALSCDPISAFGGIVAFNSEVDEDTAEKLNDIFLEIICAPSYSVNALEKLKTKKNRRLIKVKKNLDKDELVVKSVPGGLLIQEKDNSKLDESMLKYVTERKCSEKELEDLKLAWVVCKHTKSNAIVFVKEKKAIGVGAGQMSRLDSAKIAAMKAKEFGHDLNGAVAASDAFFPFADGLLEIASHGITAVIQPGGSVRDDEVIKAANEKNISMIFTGIRNFKH
ncbi:bifunctional phosphoribosylaminoimidazolecarboxamide formyltransferase/IMP cyclohydrolase [Ignavibacteria bacterium 4148-Me]|uniref:bifunctional phosphoribosylaminoimidazolecarboxamide formyltransferase/IMP cyclohydrolase n=1 Tax=Rosettibacter primus TaxID=3111523 RepID=UPI00336BFB4A